MDDARRRRLLALVVEEAATRRGGYWWRPRGFSMRPAIEDGDRVLVEPVDAARLRVGHVVKFSHAGAFRMHRIVRRTSAGGRPSFLVRGDTGGGVDLIDAAQVIGLAVVVERGSRTVRLDTFAARTAWRARTLRGWSIACVRRLGAAAASLTSARWIR